MTHDKELVWDYFVEERREGRFPILSDVRKYPRSGFPASPPAARNVKPSSIAATHFLFALSCLENTCR